MTVRFLVSATAFVVSSAAAIAASISPLPSASEVAVPLQITVYDKPEFKGSALVIDRAIPDLNALKFDNKVASLTITGAGDWVLCEHKNYTGRCARVQLQAANLKLFHLNDRVSSLYPVPAPAAPATRPD
jgi:hypothetical protein